MSLIEQLGGYERAKKLVDDCKRYGRSDVKVPVNGGFIHIVADFLELDLLEYRRQHNIFEVGDKAVYLSGIAPDHNDIYELSKIGKMYHVLKIGLMDYNAKFNHIRHATDAEIEAGRRL